MLIYQSSKKEFMDYVTNDEISIKIEKEYKKRIGKANLGEIRSWKNSMDSMYKVLNTNEIPDECGIAIEYRIPATSKRIDFILSGLDENNKENLVIIELKQWEEINAIEDEDGIVSTYINKGIRKTPHPSYQVWSYYSLIKDYNSSVEENKINIVPCAYLHNYYKDNNDPIENKVYDYYLEKAPAFTRGEAIKLREFICKHVKKEDHKKGLYDIESGKIKPSKSLQDSLKLMIDGNEEFIMIDDQKVIYESIMKKINYSIKNNKKNVIIVEGGPGTGKSVLAINLLVKIINKDLTCQYITKNSAPREVYIKKLKGNYKQTYINNLFKGSGNYINTSENEFDVLLVDEAHRLNEKSGMFHNLGENQIKEIIKSSKVSIFFIDENQKVTLDDIGSIAEIERISKEYNIKIKYLKLESQFRCNGSDGYLSWVDDVLEIKQTANFDGFEFDYDFKVFDNPNDMRKAIEEKNVKDNKSRIVAGYCWDWKTKKNSKENEYDIEIPESNFKMKWNLGSSKTWAIDETSINEVGCIHTCQGLEFDYVGVILGNDIRFDGQKIITDFNERAKSDRSLRGIKKMYKENKNKALELADKIIKNTYRTLMTRGIKGCYIYCCDKKLKEYFIERINGFHNNITFKDIIDSSNLANSNKTIFNEKHNEVGDIIIEKSNKI